MSVPFFSVIIRTYNVENFIAETLNSVFNQTFNDYEVIIVDDGSTDNTGRIVKELISTDSRFSFYEIQHSGNPAVPFNYGARLAKGIYIAILDSDDLWTKNKLKEQYLYIQKNPEKVLVYSACVTFFNVNIFSKSYEVLPLPFKVLRKRNEIPQKGNTIGASATVFKRDLAEKFGFMDEDPDINEDFYVWIKLSESGDFGFIPKIHMKYRIHGRQNSLGWEKRRRLISRLSEKTGIKLPEYGLIAEKGLLFGIARNSVHILSYLFYTIMNFIPYKLLLKFLK